MKKILIIGHTFPEPSTTAVGSRMMQLISVFKESNYSIVFASTASISDKSVDFEKEKIKSHNIKLNDSSFDIFLKEINPDIVLFDRFITEEQFGWRVTEQCPNAIRILDTEDLHFLRKARLESYKKYRNLNHVNLFTETAKRELASIYRCDLSLIISEKEMLLLQDTFSISKSILEYVPFLIEEDSLTAKNSFENRTHFISIGNLLHAPNVDSVIFLKKEIWPIIKNQIPEAELHIYGNYAPQQIIEMHNEKESFLIKGWAEDVNKVMSEAKVCLAPLNFGAGLKGKIIDSMLNHTPVVTTTIGAEGIQGNLVFAGKVVDDVESFIKESCALYLDKGYWVESSDLGKKIIMQRFLKEKFAKTLIQKIEYLDKNLPSHRNKNFIGEILNTHKNKATKYMSMWIEEKNKHII